MLQYGCNMHMRASHLGKIAVDRVTRDDDGEVRAAGGTRGAQAVQLGGELRPLVGTSYV